MSRPETSKKESRMSVADAVVWSFSTYGIPKGVADGVRPDNKESIMSVNDTVEYAWT